MANYKDINLIGYKFFKLEVIRFKEETYKSNIWVCLCVCGNEIELTSATIIKERVKSCGCILKSKTQKHNFSKRGNVHPLYRVWLGVNERCNNKNHKNYPIYGGRGIVVCEEWKNDFLTFYNWAIEAGWKKGLTIDRIDNNGNYCPENCRIATQKQQQNNKKNNHLIEYNNENMTLAQAVDKYGVENLTQQTFLSRLRQGWTIEEALTKKVKKRS